MKGHTMSNKVSHDATLANLCAAIQQRLDYLIDEEVDVDGDGDHTDQSTRDEMNALAAAMLMMGFTGNRIPSDVIRQTRILRGAFEECQNFRYSRWSAAS